MKTVFLLLAIVASAALAASIPAAGGLAAVLPQFPECALPCLVTSLTESKCNITDTACICADETSQASVATCVLTKCSITESLLVKKITNTACGVPIRNRGRKYTLISNTLSIISGVFVLQRLGYKIWARLEFGWDDGFCLIAILSGVPAAVFNAHWLPQNGMGRDVWNLTASQITKFGIGFYVIQVLYLERIATIKLSLLFFYIRIFPSRGVRRLLLGTVAFISIWGIASVVVGIFECKPISYFWTKWDGTHSGRCLDLNGLAWCSAGTSIAADIWILAIPMWQLKSLQLDLRRKVGVGLMFVMGTFVTVVSILRLRSLITFGADSQNPTWEYFDVAMWSNIEINVAIICTCLPSLRLLLVRLFPTVLRTTQRYYAQHSNSGNKSTLREPRRFGTVSTSRAELDPFHGQHELNQISYQKTYAVDYGHMDDAELVSGASEIDIRSSQSFAYISARESSEKAYGMT